jgi:hypothetical protein
MIGRAKKKKSPSADQHARIARDEGVIPLAFGCCALVLAYTAIHALQQKLFPQPDPRLVLVTQRVAFFWNLVLSVYVAAMIVAAVLAARRRFGGAAVDRFLAPLVALAAVVGVAHAVFFP